MEEAALENSNPSHLKRMQPTRVHWWVEATGCPDVSVSVRRHDDDGGRAEGGGGGGGGSSSTAQSCDKFVYYCQRGPVFL